MGRAGVKITKVGRTKHEDGRWRTVDGDFVVDIGPCPGDSGGPALDQDGKLIGVMSRGHESTCTEMIYTRVDHHATWLTGLIEASLQRNPDASTS
jgi:secreted trypsin-like serine protease